MDAWNGQLTDLEVCEVAVVDEAGSVVEVVVARVGALRPELHHVRVRRGLAVKDGAAAQLIGRHPRHDHRRALNVAQRDVHLRPAIREKKIK